MTESLVNIFLNLFESFNNLAYGKELIIFIISLMPILELRGGLIAASLLGVNPVTSFIICFIGNILPIPFILWFITPIFNWLKHTKHLKGLVEKLEAKADKKKEQIEKSEFWGLLLFVGIPLPGTGAWTGTLIASLLNMNKKKALIASILGVVLAGAIMMLFSFGFLKSII